MDGNECLLVRIGTMSSSPLAWSTHGRASHVACPEEGGDSSKETEESQSISHLAE